MVSPSLRNGGAYAATDFAVHTAPLREDDPEQRLAANPLQTDQFIQLGFTAEFWSSLRAGDVQLWEPDIGGGVPLMTTTYTRVLSPTHVILRLVAAPFG